MTVVAVGWATVELDRAADELAPLLASGAVFAPAVDCLHLGARCRIGALGAPIDGAMKAILLEPSTEGRLAVTLARHGEGWCASWIDDPDDSVGKAVAPGTSWSAVRDGPLGPERLVLGGRVDGPHRLRLVAATIGA